jgi:hypothetical protein
MLRERLQQHFADNTSEQSVATRLRRRRFQLLLDMLEGAGDRVTVLDIGGRPKYWEMMTAGTLLGGRLHITLLNVEAHHAPSPNVDVVVGDGRSMPQFSDGQFDIVFSNSTIEHVGSFADQQRMAAEVRRVGRRYYVQTPNRHFPIEPHFVFPLFQYLPVPTRVWLVRHFSLGWLPRTPDVRLATQVVEEIRLLTRGEMERLFPDATIHEERFSGLVKSFVAYTPSASRPGAVPAPGGVARAEAPVDRPTGPEHSR